MCYELHHTCLPDAQGIVRLSVRPTAYFSIVTWHHFHKRIKTKWNKKGEAYSTHDIRNSHTISAAKPHQNYLSVDMRKYIKQGQKMRLGLIWHVIWPNQRFCQHGNELHDSKHSNVIMGQLGD